MRVAEYIAGKLFDAGVRFVYGIPGGPSIPYMEALKKRGIEFILVSNESSAGIMADVTARLTGIPGVCHSTFGPGATNISTGVGGAFLDRSPVIVLTSEIEEKMINRTVQMNIDHQKLFAPLTKATFRLNAANAAKIMKDAMSISLDELPGPVHIGLPAGIEDDEVTDAEASAAETAVISYNNDIQTITELLSSSRKPLLAIGLTAYRLGIKKELSVFLEKYRIPVLVTPMAKGLINEDHPSYTGVLFHALSDYLDEIIWKSDLVIGLGYDPVEYNYESWIPEVPLVHFGTRPVDLPVKGRVVEYTGEPEDWFSILNNLNAGMILSQKTIIEGIRNEITSVLNGFSDHFGPVTALRILKKVLPENAIVTADVGSHLHLTGQLWDTSEKDRLIITNGWSGMGFGIPAAMAACLLRPGTTVACITGDGGFLMMAGEMITAKRYNLPIIVVVLSDGELNLIKLKQSWKNLPAYCTKLYDGDLFGADQFLGVKVFKADTPENFEISVKTALTLNEPVIINTLIDPEDYKWLVTSSRKNKAIS